MAKLIENKEEIAEFLSLATDLSKAGLSVQKFDYKKLVRLPDYEFEEENIYLKH